MSRKGARGRKGARRKKARGRKGIQGRKTRPRTTEQVRASVDSGRTGDKVAGADPAAVPLGADEEAGGTPESAGLSAEAPHVSRADDSPSSPLPVQQAQPRKRAPALWLIAIGLVVAGLVGAMFVL